jgi:putative endonuclease
MKKYVFIITDRNRTNLQVGLSTDLMKTMDFYSEMPCLFFDPGQQLSRLVYFEEYDNEQMANSRFRLINQFTKMQKERLVRTVNLDWIDLTPALQREASLHLQAELLNFARVA